MKYTFCLPLMLLLTSPAEAGKNTGVPECPAPSGSIYKIRDFTNYSPRGARGIMNGKCEQSNVYKDALDEKRGGPMKHGACNYELEDHLAGKTNAVMGAVPLKGRASNLLGAIYRGVALDQAIGVSGTFIYVGDTYGKGWHTRECKMDIITKAVKSPLTRKINAAKGGDLIKLARGDIPSPSRKVPRDPAAMESIEALKADANPGVSAAGAGAVAGLQLPDGEHAPIPRANPRRQRLPAGEYAPIPTANPRRPASAETAGQNPPGRYSGVTTEDIEAYYDQFKLPPTQGAAEKNDRLKRNPASVEELKEPSSERFGR